MMGNKETPASYKTVSWADVEIPPTTSYQYEPEAATQVLAIDSSVLGDDINALETPLDKIPSLVPLEDLEVVLLLLRDVRLCQTHIKPVQQKFLQRGLHQKEP